MFVYSGTHCPYCEKPLTETDDLAVCPECGTPHHRACYMEHGACANAAKHAAGFEWAAPTPTASQSEQNTAKTAAGEESPEAFSANAAHSAQRRCLNCGTVAGPHDHFCLHCGAVLPRTSQVPNFNTPGSRSTAAYQQQSNAAQPPFAARLNMDERVDGIPVRDWMIYFGNSAFSFLSAFKRQEVTGKKTGFTFAAFLTPTLYFLYFRAWKMAGLSFLLSFLLQSPSYYLNFFPIAGNYLFGIPLQTVQLAAKGLNVLYFIFCVVCGIYAAYIMRIDSGKKIRNMRRACTNEQEYMQLLTRKKCPSKVVIGGLVGYIVVLFALMFI